MPNTHVRSRADREVLRTLFVGAGPAGLAPLVYAARSGLLPGLAARGLAVVDGSDEPGAGALDEHAIGSDTLADTFLECLGDGAEPRLCALRDHPAARRVAEFQGGTAPLVAVSSFLRVLGRTLREILVSQGAIVLAGHRATASRQLPGGLWRTQIGDPAGDELQIVSERLVLATGAEQRLEDIGTEQIGGRSLLPCLDDRILLSGDALSHGGAQRIAGRLRGRSSHKVAVIGGSHSALACANLLLSPGSGIDFAAGDVSLLHRRPLRLFYPSAEAAIADGYDDFTDRDVCPLTHRLYRLAGFRLDARALARRALGVGGAVADPRLRLHRLGASAREDEAWDILDHADLVIAALGYRPRALPLLDMQGEPIRLAAQANRAAALVDADCRVVGHDRQPVPGVFAIGLAAGFVPSGPLGGEPSFRGQTNGLWLWQNDVGAMIVRQLLQQEADHAAA